MDSTIGSYLLSHSLELRLLTGVLSIGLGLVLIKTVMFISNIAKPLLANSRHYRLSANDLSSVNAR
jgi:hypothetical protein